MYHFCLRSISIKTEQNLFYYFFDKETTLFHLNELSVTTILISVWMPYQDTHVMTVNVRQYQKRFHLHYCWNQLLLRNGTMEGLTVFFAVKICEQLLLKTVWVAKNCTKGLSKPLTVKNNKFRMIIPLWQF